jgi:hypothetical protein
MALSKKRIHQGGESPYPHEREALAFVLGALDEVLPWVQQWHNDPVDGTRAGDAFSAFLDEELRRNGITTEALAAWRL